MHPSMKYVVRTLPVKLSQRSFALQRHPLPSGLTGPTDIRLATFGDARWVTASPNAVARFQDGAWSVFRRNSGVRPHLLVNGPTPDSAAFWFTDPAADAIGRISSDGTFLPDLPTGTGSAPTACCAWAPLPWARKKDRLVGAAGAPAVFRESAEGLVQIDCPHASIDAVSWGPGWSGEAFWYVSGRTLQCMGYTEMFGISTGAWCLLPAGARITELVCDSDQSSLYYCDEGREVIGRVAGRPGQLDEELVEYHLPGLAPRVLTLSPDGVWFIGRGGSSLFRMRNQRVTEFRCADASADLTRLVWDSNDTFWFAEPKANGIATARLYGF